MNVDWFQKGGQYTESPLLKIIENKIHASEKIYGYDLTENVWDTYFAPQINCGVIGNSGRKMTFKFFGDRDLSPMDDMILHRPLRNFFGVNLDS